MTQDAPKLNPWEFERRLSEYALDRTGRTAADPVPRVENGADMSYLVNVIDKKTTDPEIRKAVAKFHNDVIALQIAFIDALSRRVPASDDEYVPCIIRNDSAGFYEFVTEDVPALYGGMMAANIERIGKLQGGDLIGFRIYDETPLPEGKAEPVGQHDALPEYDPTSPLSVAEHIYAQCEQTVLSLSGLPEHSRDALISVFSHFKKLELAALSTPVKP